MSIEDPEMIGSQNYTNQLESLRHCIDDIDADVIRLLGQRFGKTRRVGALKAVFNANPVDVGREEAVFSLRQRLATEHGVPTHTVDSVYRLIITEVVHEHHQASVRNL